MKLIYLYTIGIFIMFMSPSSYLCAQGVAENNQFFDWKESDYKAYEDSLLKALYPPVIAKLQKIRKGFHSNLRLLFLKPYLIILTFRLQLQ